MVRARLARRSRANCMALARLALAAPHLLDELAGVGIAPREEGTVLAHRHAMVQERVVRARVEVARGRAGNVRNVAQAAHARRLRVHEQRALGGLHAPAARWAARPTMRVRGRQLALVGSPRAIRSADRAAPRARVVRARTKRPTATRRHRR